jgi:hypothetical protein
MDTATAQRLLVLAVILGLVVAWLSALRPAPPETGVSITHVGDTNLPQQHCSLLRIQNDGSKTIRLNTYYTVYWTNELGRATNEFVKNEHGYAVLRPRAAIVVRAPAPADAKTWTTSFTYEVRPSFLRGIQVRVASWISPSWLPTEQFIGRFGPTITNVAYKAEG